MSIIIWASYAKDFQRSKGFVRDKNKTFYTEVYRVYKWSILRNGFLPFRTSENSEGAVFRRICQSCRASRIYIIPQLSLTTQKMKFSIKDFCIKCEQICSFLKKSKMENFIFLCSDKPLFTNILQLSYLEKNWKLKFFQEKKALKKSSLQSCSL